MVATTPCTCGGRSICTVCVLAKLEAENLAAGRVKNTRSRCSSTTPERSFPGRVQCDGFAGHPGLHYCVMTHQRWSV